MEAAEAANTAAADGFGGMIGDNTPAEFGTPLFPDMGIDRGDADPSVASDRSGDAKVAFTCDELARFEEGEVGPADGAATYQETMTSSLVIGRMTSSQSKQVRTCKKNL